MFSRAMRMRHDLVTVMANGAAVLPTPPLDGMLNVVAAYSVRKLRTDYTGNCVLLRRSTDDAELGFSFGTDNWLDTAAITTWLGGGTGYVKTWYDQSGAGLDFSEADNAKQPSINLSALALKTYRPALKFASSAMATAAVNWGSDKLTISTIIKTDEGSGARCIIEMSADTNTNNGFLLYLDTTDIIDFLCKPGTTCIYKTAKAPHTNPVRVTATWDAALTTNEQKIYMDGVQNGATTTDTNTSGNLPNAKLFLGARNESTIPYAGHIPELILFKSALSDTAREALETDQYTQFGLDFYIPLADFADNGYTTEVAVGGYFKPNPGSRLLYNTNATLLTIETFNNLYSTYPGFCEIGLRINGADVQTIDPTAAGAVRQTVALPGGSQDIELITGLQMGGAARNGTFIRGLCFNATATKNTPITTPRIVVYGDSITVGANATNPTLQGWCQLVRASYNGSLVIDAWGSRAMHDDCVDATARTAFVAHLAAYSPTILWLAIGTNDYGGVNGNIWTAADFGVAYADFLDKVNASMPTLVIYAQTPIVRSPETANLLGDALSAYRTAISDAVATRTAFCTLVDGTGASFPQVADLGDGTHPTTEGQAKYAAAVKTVLGL